MQDIGKFDTVAGSQEGFEVELFRPDTLAGLGIFITVLGRDSEEFKRVQSDYNRARVSRVQRAGGRMPAIDPKEIENEQIDMLAACTKSWRTVDLKSSADPKPAEPIVLLNGEKLECSAKNAARLYRGYPWAREQIDEAVTNRANFLKPSRTG